VITADYIWSLPYPEFVGLVNQWNVLPGSYSTLTKWAANSRMDKSSRLLQVACTTGFQARELALMTGCQAHGFDRAELAVRAAIYNAERYAPDVRVTYEQADGYEFQTEEKFTHVAVGAGLKFFADPERAFRRFVGFLSDGGYMLASPFYIRGSVPDSVIEQAKATFGITPTLEGYDEVMHLYRDLEIMFEDRCKIEIEVDSEIDRYCDATIQRFSEITPSVSEEASEAARDRLKEIRKASNALRPYQEYSVLVLRYRKSTYPNRYVELF
jgi:ubiquinone/menaquinone biosynthesis C-methylase UbiE